MNLDLRATPEDVMRGVEALQQFAAAQQIPDGTIFDLALALEECASNVVHHAFKRDGQRTFRIAAERTHDAFIIEVRDDGPAFDPSAAPPLDAQLADDGASGGWGLALMRRAVDDIHYRREAGTNVLRLTKRLVPAFGTEAGRSRASDRHPERSHVMPLEIRIQKDGPGGGAGVVTVTLIGSLDTATAPSLEAQLAPLLQSATDIVFNLAQLTFISSAGLRVFAMTRKALKERGGQASFVQMPPHIQDVFEIIKALPGVAVFKDVAELDRYLAARQRARLEGE